MAVEAAQSLKGQDSNLTIAKVKTICIRRASDKRHRRLVQPSSL